MPAMRLRTYHSLVISTLITTTETKGKITVNLIEWSEVMIEIRTRNKATGQTSRLRMQRRCLEAIAFCSTALASADLSLA